LGNASLKRVAERLGEDWLDVVDEELEVPNAGGATEETWCNGDVGRRRNCRGNVLLADAGGKPGARSAPPLRGVRSSSASSDMLVMSRKLTGE